MTESTQFIRCDRRYLTARFGSILFVFMVLFFIDLLFWHTIVIAGLMGTLSLRLLQNPPDAAPDGLRPGRFVS